MKVKKDIIIYEIENYPFSVTIIKINRTICNIHYYHILEHLLVKEIENKFHLKIKIKASTNKENINIYLILFDERITIFDILSLIENYKCKEIEFNHELELINDEYSFLYDNKIKVNISYNDFNDFVNKIEDNSVGIELYINNMQIIKNIENNKDNQRINITIKEINCEVSGYVEIL